MSATALPETAAQQSISPYTGPGEGRRALHWALVALLLVLGAATRLYHLDHESLWLDEQITWNQVDAPTLGQYIAHLRTRDATFVPAYYALLYWWAYWTDYSIFAARLLSVGLALAASVAAYLAARRAFGRTAALITLFCLMFSNIHVYYAQEVRVYALYLLAAALSTATLPPALSGGWRGWWLLHQAANVLLVFSHYFGALILLAEGVYLALFHRRPFKRLACWFGAQAALALLLLWWMRGIDPAVLEMTTDFLKVPRASDIEYAFSWAVLYLPRCCYSQAWLPVFAAGALACVFLRELRKSSRERQEWAVLCILWLLAPTALVLAASYAVRPVITLRYLLPASLPFFMLLGAMISALPKRLPRGIALAVLAGLMLLQHCDASRPFRPDMANAGEWIGERKQESDGLLLVGDIDYESQCMYVPQPKEHLYRCVMAEEAVQETANLLARYDAVWVLIVYDYTRQFSPQKGVEDAFADRGIQVERFEASSDHYTLLSTWNWPALSDIGRRIVVYRAVRQAGNHPQ